jgi:hypothetical protein
MNAEPTSQVAIPLTPIGAGAYIEATAAAGTKGELTLTEELAAYFRNNHREVEADVDLRGEHYYATVFVPQSGTGLAYVVTDSSRTPIGVTLARTRASWSAQTMQAYFDHLEQRVSVTESLYPSEDVPLWSRFVQPEFSQVDAEGTVTGARLSWERLKGFGRLVILGEPGSGKSACLRRLALEYLDTPARLVPVYLQLRGLSSHALETSLIAELLSAEPGQLSFPELAESGSILLLLDGLDEVPLDGRRQMVDDLRSLCWRYPRVRVVLTARRAGYEWSLDGFVHAMMLPFSDAQVAEWTMLNMSDSPDWARFLTKLWSSEDTRELIRQPLLLSITTALFRRYAVLPICSADLYRAFVRALVDEWDRARAVARVWPTPSPEATIRILSDLSYVLCLSGRSTFSHTDSVFSSGNELLRGGSEAARWLQAVEERTGLIDRCSRTEFRFTHKSLQDYLAAEWLVGMTKDVNEDLSMRTEDPDWERVWTLSCQLTSDPTSLIMAAMQSRTSAPVVARLLATAVAEGTRLDDNVRGKAWTFIARALGRSLANWRVVQESAEHPAAPTPRMTLRPTGSHDGAMEARLRETVQLLRALHGALQSESSIGLKQALRESKPGITIEVVRLLESEGVFHYEIGGPEGDELTFAIYPPIARIVVRDSNHHLGV